MIKIMGRIILNGIIFDNENYFWTFGLSVNIILRYLDLAIPAVFLDYSVLLRNENLHVSLGH